MNRRGFIKGLGALLATSAMVRPAVPSVLEVITNAMPASVPPIEGGYFVSICHPQSLLFELRRLNRRHGVIYEGEIGNYLGFALDNDSE